jgi:dTDP-4-amino-4,6-dideoxy-D-glucose acyltransferase
MAWLDRQKLLEMGFASIGDHALVSDRASFYGCERISLGDNVRIDDFCLLSAGAGGICIGCHVHIAAYSLLVGAGRIVMSDFSGVSSRVSIYSSNDDYSGVYLTNPTVPALYTNVSSAKVYLGRHVIVGSGSVILPGVTLQDGVAVGALSLVNRDCEEFGVYSGVPAKRIKSRERGLLEREQDLMRALRSGG